MGLNQLLDFNGTQDHRGSLWLPQPVLLQLGGVRHLPVLKVRLRRLLGGVKHPTEVLQLVGLLTRLGAADGCVLVVFVPLNSLEPR